jgi:hypothetical protein
MVNEPQDPKVARRLYSSMNHFRNLPETRIMVEWLESELLRLDKANRHEEVDDAFKRKQGACQVLEKILSMVSASSDKLTMLDAAIQKSNARR